MNIHAIRSCIIIAMALCLNLNTSFAQGTEYTFSGRVTQAQTGKPLQNVNVYLRGTTDGQATDSTGRYNFKTRQVGHQEIVASFIGYKRARKTVLVGTQKSYHFDFELERNHLVMDELSVTGSNREWSRNYRYFEREFLGSGTFSDKVIIENPYVLDFKTDDQFVATAVEALKIRNEALGYHVRIELVSFVFDPTVNTGYYQVLPYFTPMEAPNEQVRRRWEHNRAEAYEGSMRHYLKSLYHRRLQADDFYQDPSNGIEQVNRDNTIGILTSVGIRQLKDVYKVYRFRSNEVTVAYDVRRNRIGQVVDYGSLSYLSPGDRDRYFLITKEGLLFNTRSVEVAGKWGRDRIAKLLPMEYSPE